MLKISKFSVVFNKNLALFPRVYKVPITNTSFPKLSADTNASNNRCQKFILPSITIKKNELWNRDSNNNILTTVLFYSAVASPFYRISNLNCTLVGNVRHLYISSLNSSKEKEKSSKNLDEDESKLSLYQKFKLMYSRYWYVLVPVHMVTSVIWFGGFYFAAKSGINITYLESFGVPESILYYLRANNAGYYGIAYGLYKIATPARYTVTVGGTAVSIKYLKEKGYIKPVPTKDELKTMYKDKKDEFIDKRDEVREKYQEKREEIREKYQETIEKYQDKSEEFRDRYKEKKDEFLEKYKEKLKENEKKKR